MINISTKYFLNWEGCKF